MLLLVSLLGHASGHGHLTWPPNRVGGHVSMGGDCTNGACYWFSNNVEIAVDESLPVQFRTLTNGGTPDVFAKAPWRAPGRAPTYGSGCGSAGGGPKRYHNGGGAPACVDQGQDGVEMPAGEVTTWQIGSTADVAFSLSANHGGGYSYRLCKKSNEVTEECFQQGALKFAGDKSYIIDLKGNIMKEFPLTRVTEGTWPEGSEWARDPIPGCKMCDDAQAECGDPLPPKATNEEGGEYNDPWNTQVNCYAQCSGSHDSKAVGLCPEGTEFYEALAGFSGFSKEVPKWSIMDKVLIPADFEEGDYLLSWRWDCEESTQVWQNCADVRLTSETVPPIERDFVGMPDMSSDMDEKDTDSKKDDDKDGKDSKEGDYSCALMWHNPTCKKDKSDCLAMCKTCNAEEGSLSCDECCEGCKRVEKDGDFYCVSDNYDGDGKKDDGGKDGRYPGIGDTCAGDVLKRSQASSCSGDVECWTKAELSSKIDGLNTDEKTVVISRVIGGFDIYDLGDWFSKGHPGGDKRDALKASEWMVEPILLKSHGMVNKAKRLERAGGKLIATTALTKGKDNEAGKQDGANATGSAGATRVSAAVALCVAALTLVDVQGLRL